MPESSDSDFSWSEFVRRNNDELVATYGNLVNRVLTFTYRNYDGHIPTREEMGAGDGELPLDDRDNDMLEKSLSVMEEVLGDNGLIARCRFKQAITSAMGLAHEANRYLDEKEPWKVIKQDRARAAVSLYVTLGVIVRLKSMMYPFLPFTSQKLHEYLGFESRLEEYGLRSELPEPGRELLKPGPLFTKLAPEIAEEESSRLGQVKD